MHFLKEHSLLCGILLMFLLTWPIDLANSKVLPVQIPFAVYILLGYGFIIASLVMTGLTLGRKAAVGLLKRFLIWQVSWQWYLVALLLVTLFHAAINTAGVFLPVANTQTGSNMGVQIAFIVLEILFALVVIISQRPARLSQKENMQIQPGPTYS
jgi:hypothetical protein